MSYIEEIQQRKAQIAILTQLVEGMERYRLTERQYNEFVKLIHLKPHDYPLGVRELIKNSVNEYFDKNPGAIEEFDEAEITIYATADYIRKTIP